MTANTHRNALQPGHRVLWYQIERILGQGGFGITYLAFDTNLNQHVAIKEYLPIELAVRENNASVHPVSEGHEDHFKWGMDRFISEARTLAKFDHPNIVRVLSVFEANNTAYMVMRYEEGKSLHELLPRWGTLEEQDLLKIVVPILGGLRAVHAAGYIHRDIKPGNIFVRVDGSPVLIDFGSSRQALGQATHTLTTLVSPGYAPFEQYVSKSDKQGPWTDIYGLGATLYRAVTGKQPVDAVDRSEGLLNDAADPLVPVTESVADRYSSRFLGAIDHALKFREDERPQTVDEWLDDFGKIDFDSLAAMLPLQQSAATDKSTTTAATLPPLAFEDDTAQLTDAVAPPEDVQDATQEAGDGMLDDMVWSRFIGNKNSDYYRQRFQNFSQRKSRWPMSWHWPAAFFGIPWMMYRKMYWWALLFYPLLTALFTIVALVLVSIVTGGKPVPDAAATIMIMLVSIVWSGLFANAIYFRRSQRLRTHMSAHDGDTGNELEWIAKKGGTSTIAAIIGIVFSFLLWAAITDDNRKQRQATREQQVQQLVNDATRNFTDLKLTTPADDNAWDKLQQVLALDANNEEAKAGMRSIIENMAKWEKQQQ